MCAVLRRVIFIQLLGHVWSKRLNSDRELVIGN